MVGGLIGNYRIVSKLASGGMGEVYVAEHRHMGRRAAVKVLLPELSKRQDVIMRLFDEARAASHIDHPGIVQIYDCDYYEPTGQAYLVMELLHGQTLRQRLLARKGTRDERWAARVGLGIAEPLAAAHAVGIVHRDLKPENIFLVGESGRETVKVLDFGVAKLSHALRGRTTSTLEGSILGTPLYMSPEQCRGERDLDARADIYSLGCVLYEMLCGRPPFVSDTPTGLIAAHLCDPVPPPESFTPGLSPALSALLRSMLEKDPQRRPSDMQAVVDRLVAHLGMDLPVRARTPAMGAAPGGTAPLDVPATGEAPAHATTLGQTASESVSARARPRPVSRTALIAIGLGGLGMVSAALYFSRREAAPGEGPGAAAPPAAEDTGRVHAGRVEPARKSDTPSIAAPGAGGAPSVPERQGPSDVITEVAPSRPREPQIHGPRISPRPKAHDPKGLPRTQHGTGGRRGSSSTPNERLPIE